MDQRFEVKAAPRPIPGEKISDTPLVAMAWRALRAEHQRRAAEQAGAESQARAARDALLAIAEGAFQIQKLAQTSSLGEGQSRRLLGALESILAALDSAGVNILAPQGEVYTDELMELIDNIAQQYSESIQEPTVLEVTLPSLFMNGDLVRRGKAVIALPARQAGGSTQKDLLQSSGPSNHPESSSSKI